MTLTVEATYENGVLRPGRPLPLREREKVELVIQRQSPAKGDTASAPADEERQAALQRLLALQLPASDWDEMEREIVCGALE